MDTRRSFIKKASTLASGAGLLHVLPASIAKALAIDPKEGSTFLDAEHIVFLMQENRSFDHTYGTLQGVRGFNDPRAITLPNKNSVWLQSNELGQTYAPFRYDIKNTKITWMSSLPHSWSDQVDARNEGRYDRWLQTKQSGHKEYASMPLTMGYYTRADIPFYYSLADAFTVCDQNFCSALTGTTPNRLYFWTGTVRERPDEKAQANVWNEDADYDTMVHWKTFPERLEEQGISWKVYQNELSVGVGFEGEEDGWLANFGDNALEYFTQYHVKLHPEYIKALPKNAQKLQAELTLREEKLAALPDSDKDAAQKLKKQIDWIKKAIATNAQDQKQYTLEKWEALSPFEKKIHQNAFVTNRKDPFYHELTSLNYTEEGKERVAKLPKGDILHQFRQDVDKGQLPTVSWLVAPENFSDHPSSAWYGAWYISEVMDILTKNPEVWKKTIFILTYDENDGYFDHIPPFVAPHPDKPETGAVSKGIDTAVEYVSNVDQQSQKDRARESSIGLGYRVPLVIASPWSRGGWVNSEVFDHTSSLRFLEQFLSHKTGKKIKEPNISQWRRTVCGDLTSTFRPYDGKAEEPLQYVKRDEFIESIHKAQYKNPPSNYRSLSVAEVDKINQNPLASNLLAKQEEGIRSSCALPYELYADGLLKADKRSFEITLRVGKEKFGAASAGAPFHVYAPGAYQKKAAYNRSYAVAPGDRLSDQWLLQDFDDGRYHLCVYGPNGFFREFKGDAATAFEVEGQYERIENKKPSGNLVLRVKNLSAQRQTLRIIDNAYGQKTQERFIEAKGTLGASSDLIVLTTSSFGWYDISIKLVDEPSFERRYAGRIETGRHSKTDPFMGQVVQGIDKLAKT